jgi:predicted dehydrogenase
LRYDPGVDGSRRAIVWLNPEQAPLVRSVAHAAELTIVAAGSPAKGQSGHVAAELDTKACDDLRAVLATAECELVWIAAAGGFGASPGTDDAASVSIAQGRGVTIATLEPIPASALALESGWTVDSNGICPLDAVRFVPLARHSAPFRDASELLPGFGEIGTLAVESWSGPGEGSLGAHLYGALELVHALMGEPETIEATYVSAAPGRSMHALPGESLRDLHGDLTANLRFADGRAAALVCSDRAGRWSRAATLIGPGGRFRILDDSFEWIGPGGDRLDQSKPRPRKAQSPPEITALATALTRILEPGPPEAAPTDHAAVLAIAQAALLSCRTGQGESPATIRRMLGTP